MTAPRSILIIGASRGLGLGLAGEFAAQGWAVTHNKRRCRHCKACVSSNWR